MAFFELGEQFMDRQNIGVEMVFVRAFKQTLFYIRLIFGIRTLLRFAAAGVVDQDLAHVAGGDSEEMLKVLDGRKVVFLIAFGRGEQTQPQEIHERGSGRAERVIFSLAGHEDLCDALQLGIDTGGELITSLLVAGADPVEQVADFVSSLRNHAFYDIPDGWG